jgi:uncharacterized protein (DUF302 family)
METEQYGMTVRTELPFEAAEAAIREALAGEGFGILTEIDIAATFKAKLDLDRPKYKILGACAPELASRAIALDPRAGLLLPCNVTIDEGEDGTVVSILDPDKMITLMDNPAAEAFAQEARTRLAKALSKLEA